MSERFARTPRPPYYAVIFANQRTPGDDGYGATADRMVELASKQPGFLGIESTRDEAGFGITVSYWESEAAIAAWRADADQLAPAAVDRFGGDLRSGDGGYPCVRHARSPVFTPP